MPRWRDCFPRTSRSVYRNRSQCLEPRSRSERGCPGVAGRSARSCSPSPTWAATLLGFIPPPPRTAMTYVLNGIKLWTTNGVIADLLVVMAQVPQSDGHARWHHRVRGGGEHTRHRGGKPQCVHGVARHRKRLHPADQRTRTGREPHRPRKVTGYRLRCPRSTSGRLSLPAICTGWLKWCLKIAREWSRGAGAVGPADR